MNFGKVDHPENMDFTLPETHSDTIKVLNKSGNKNGFKDVRIGCAKWNKKDLKNFYPKGTKDELKYYSSQFNSIEFNGSFYRMYPEEQFEKWYGKADDNFKFFPKVPRIISHIKRLNGTEGLTDDFVKNLLQLKEKLGMVFLQMRDDFAPKFIDRLDDFLAHWPKEIPLSLELRHPDWYADENTANELYDVLITRDVAHIITDTAGRRDLIHMRLSNTTVFIRYNGANHSSDYTRLDDWLDKLEEWHKEGLENVYFFIHQNVEEASPLLSAYFIERFNKRFKTDIKIPKTLN
ncbi:MULTISPECIES: DUF72 domain-containing protein [Salegentibacter]|jgi:uncharacterized protein YecE (DUF72 family)|uniref:Uncharacterized conserved protein YecE, DUF72 family n=1 Tax=Salegentibacter agarivorans TaxID=345907 RepID=A0A1I2KCC4_9FLAO|nr:MULTISPECIES: DUF72 domain-containing protein [Salegentibacter]SFF63949.1 Uncharacterized conserved protein YecE, DUF72 family [Salegentibacter agarivorans]